MEPSIPQLERYVRDVYANLYKLYRLGAFEEELTCYQIEWAIADNRILVYQFDPVQPDSPNTQAAISFKEAIENAYQVVLFLEEHLKSWVAEHSVEILTIKNLVYEVKDYSLEVPDELGDFFIEQARLIREHLKRGTLEAFAEEFQSDLKEGLDANDKRARVIKVQLIAALCGINHMYRLHLDRNHDEALEITAILEDYIRREMPGQHQNERGSFGLLGLTMYLKGRLLSAQGDYANAQQAYAQSSDAYISRLDQKLEFKKKGYIDEDQYREKTSVTVRRAALVSALGVGYLSFVNSRISKALAALRISRAALKQNVGAVYGAFTDMLFFACRRAEGSSDPVVMGEVVQGLESCLSTLSNLVGKSHYFHRAEIELATALHYRAKSNRVGTGEHNSTSDHERAMELLNSAVKHSNGEVPGERKNRRLLAEALIVRSYVRRHLPETEPDDRSRTLMRAEEDARSARREAVGNSRMECEALIALGSVQLAQSRFQRSISNEHIATQRLQAAQDSFRTALTVNSGKNVRIEAVCYLKLTKLNLLDPSSIALAHDHFNRWQEIENRVEHAFCHAMARDLKNQLSQGGPLLIVNAEDSLSYPEWEGRLMEHLLNTMLTKLSKETKTSRHSNSKLQSIISEALVTKMEFKKTKAYEVLKENNLVARLQSMNE
ncbi:MAG TPA: hypothetical protein VMS31_16375 [Pyrinomonadaceae bacterium]|nr:hypothetical protein [Pyrinomonadaceae bacterium]